MAAALAAAVGGPAPVVTGRYRLGDVRHITADSARARAELGWAPQVDFADGMAELAALTQPSVRPAMGRRTRNRQPPGVFSTSTVPSCASTMPRVIARPSPAPV